MEELRPQRVYTALTSLPSVVASSSHIRVNKRRPCSTIDIDVGGMGNAPPLSSR